MVAICWIPTFVIALINAEPAVASRLAGIAVFIPLHVIGELHYGARNSRRAAENLARVEQLVQSTSILLPDVETPRWYGEVRHQLRLKGRPLPANDVWIASQARHHDLTLVSGDAHFREVESLKLDVW